MCHSWRKPTWEASDSPTQPQGMTQPPHLRGCALVSEAPQHHPTRANPTSPLQTEPTSYLTLFFLFPKKARKREGLGFCLLVCHRPRALLKNFDYSAILLSTFSIFSSSHVRINSAIKRFINHAKFLLWEPNNNVRVYFTMFYYFQLSSIFSHFPLLHKQKHGVGMRSGEKMRFFMNGEF